MGFTAVETETFYFAEAARLLLQNFLFVITVIWFSENWSCQVGEMVVYQIIQAKLMFNFLTWISLSNRHTRVIKGLFIHTPGSVTAWACLPCCTENTSRITVKKRTSEDGEMFNVVHHLPSDRRDVHLQHIVKLF